MCYKTAVSAALLLCIFVSFAEARDPRIDAVDALLLARWDSTPDDTVVQIVLDPVVGKSERYQVLRLYVDRQKAVGRHRQYVQEQYLPRLERMFREMPADDVRSSVLMLQGMASLYAERDGSDTQMLAFLRQQLREPSLLPGKRLACQSLLSRLAGQHVEATSAAWQADERKLLDMLDSGSYGDAYRVALAALADPQRTAPDRLAALRNLDQMLARPTGASFRQIRTDLVLVGTGVQDPALADALIRSTMRVAFLEELDDRHVLDVLERLGRDTNLVLRTAATAALADLQAEQQVWRFDLAKHLEQAEPMVQRANLDAAGREEYRQLVDSPEYYSHLVGESPRWWFLGKLFWQHNATASSVEAFHQYLQTRDACSRVDEYLREAVQILEAAQPASGQEPVEYWSDLAHLPKGMAAHAFVKAVAQRFSGPDDRALLVQVGTRILKQNSHPDLAAAVLQAIPFSSADLTREAANLASDRVSDLRVATCAALAREGKYGEALSHLDLGRKDPVPNVPLFRVVGMADTLFAAGRGTDAEALIRVLFLRGLPEEQQINLLAYLMTQHLGAGNGDSALRVQDELFQQHGMTSPEAAAAALEKCVASIRGKNAASEAASTRLLCAVINGDAYPNDGEGALAPEESVIFWRAVRGWSYDSAMTAKLRECIHRKPKSQEADLARVLLARSALDRQQDVEAADLLEAVRTSSPVSVLAAEEQRRLRALRQQRQALAATVCQAARRLAEVAGPEARSGPVVEAYLLLAEFEAEPKARSQAIDAVVQLCRQQGLPDKQRVALQDQLSQLRVQCNDQAVLQRYDALAEQLHRLPVAASRPAEGRLVVLEGPVASAYSQVMTQIATAFREAGQYRRAVEYYHRGFEGAPFAPGAAELLKEEAWTLRFCLSAMEDSEVRLKQLVAIYPLEPAARLARTYLSTMANPLHPE